MFRTSLSFLTVCFLLCSFSLFAQQGNAPKMKYGKISDEEMAMTSYPADPAAPAVVLFDKGTVKHRYDNLNGFILEYERHKRIKIFSKDAYGFADLSLFYFKGQKVTEFKASCYNMVSGKIEETKLSSENIFEEKLTSRYFVKKGAIPGVKEGSIIEFKYTLLDEGIGLPVDEWVFQNPIAPTIWSEFEASVPTFIEYKKLAIGWTPYTLAKEELKNERLNISYSERGSGGVPTTNTPENINIDYSANILHFIQEKVPALKPEAYVASPKDYLSQINFDVKAVYNTSVVSNGPTYKLLNGGFRPINQTWERLGKDLLEDTYHEIFGSTKFTSEETEKCTAGKSTALDKTSAIYEYIGKNYQVNQFDYFWKSQTMDNLTKNRKGTPTDLNLLFINMLRRAHVQAYPVLISTRDHGKALPFRVSTEEFDRVLAVVVSEDSSLTLIDASGWPNPIGLLPEDAVNGEGLMLKNKENITWIPLQSKIADRNALVTDLFLKPDGTLSGKATFSEYGHNAVTGKETIRIKGGETFVQEDFKGLVANSQISDLIIEEQSDWNSPILKGSFALETQAFGSSSGNKIYLTPMLNMGLKETPFKNPARKFGVDFGPPLSNTMVFTFHIPTGYTIEDTPKSVKLSLMENALSFDYLVDKSNPELVKITIKRNIKTSFIPVEQFPDLQQFYSDMVAKMAEQVVLTK